MTVRAALGSLGRGLRREPSFRPGRGPDRSNPPVRSRRSRYLRARARRFVAAGLVGVAGWSAVVALRPVEPDQGRVVLVAARDLAAGSRLGLGDLRQLRLPDAVVPAAAVTAEHELTGRVLAGPISAGELLTTTRVQGPGLLAGSTQSTALDPGTVAVAVPLADRAILPSLRPGDRIRVLAVGTGALIAEGTALVVETPVATSGALSLGGTDDARLVAAVTPEAAAAMAAGTGPTGVGGGFFVAIVGPA